MGKLPVTVDDILSKTHVALIPIASTPVTVYTKAWEWGTGEDFSLDYIAASSGTVALKIELEQGNVLPGTEGSSDTNWVVAENAQEIEAALADKKQHFKKLSPPLSKYGRLKITGESGNHSSTTLRVKLSRQEEV